MKRLALTRRAWLLMLLLTAGALAAASPALAEQSPASAAAKGRIAPFSVQVIGALPPAEVKAFTAKAGTIVDKVLANPRLLRSPETDLDAFIGRAMAVMRRRSSGITVSPSAWKIAVRPCIDATDARGTNVVQSPAA